MRDGRKLLPVAAVLLAGVAAFGAGVVWLGGGDQQPPPKRSTATAPAAPAAAAEEPAAAPAESPPSAPVFVHQVPRPVLTGPGAVPAATAPAAWNGRWEKPSGYGLPVPTPLSAAEKQALNLLGEGVKLSGYQFSRTVLDDGSTVPGVEPLRPEEVEEIVLGKVRSMGMGDGFEAAIRTLAVHNPNYLYLKVSQEAEWADLEKILSPRQPAGAPRKVHYTPPGQRRQLTYQMTWYSFGWLSFGVDSGKVRMIEASFSMLDPCLVPAESIPGGRSAPDPSKALKKSRPRPANAPPRVVDALQRLGTILDVKVEPYTALKHDARLDALVAMAEALPGHPVYPGLLAAARECRGTRKVLHLFVTPSRPIPLDELTDVMEDTRMRIQDSRTFPGQTVCWYAYGWIRFGIVDGHVTKVRVDCESVPKTGL